MSEEIYLWWKAAHIVSIVTWMAGLFYLPRLFVYHAMVPVDSDRSQLLKTMERRLLHGIMHPSLVATLITGAVLLPAWLESGWMIAKLGLASVLVAYHLLCARWRVAFVHDRNIHAHVFYRVVNEIPTVVLVCIAILATIKPF